MTHVAPERPVFGTGQIVAGVLELFVRRMPKIALLTLPGILAAAGVTMIYAEFIDALVEVWIGGGILGNLVPPLLLGALAGVAIGLPSGAMVAAWRGYARHRRIDLEECFRVMRIGTGRTILAAVLIGMAVLVPWALLTLATVPQVGIFLGAAALATGMYALALWGVGVPTIPAEGLGLGAALRRGRALGDGYRWQIAGAAFLLLCSGVLLSLVLGTLVALGAYGLDAVFGIRASLRGEVAAAIGTGLISIPLVAIMPLGLAAIRARLIELKEPPDIADMAEVFD